MIQGQLRKLKFYRQITSGYSGLEVLRRTKSSDLSHHLKSEFNRSTQLNGWISTQVSGALFWKRWMVVLDCDSVNDQDMAIREIRRMDYYYKIVESGNGNFWIIVDYTGSFKKCMRFIESIPGVHSNFIYKCHVNHKITLRAFPRGGFVPVFQPGVDFTRYSQNDWYRAFVNWFIHGGTVEWLRDRQREAVEKLMMMESLARSPLGQAVGTENVKEFKERKPEIHQEPPKKGEKKRRVEINDEI